MLASSSSVHAAPLSSALPSVLSPAHRVGLPLPTDSIDEVKPTVPEDGEGE